MRERIIELDRQMLGECQKRFTNAANTATRLQHFNGLDAEPLYHPPPLANQLRSGDYGDYVLSVGRLEPIKRIDLALRAMQHVDAPTRLLIAGHGSQREDLEKLAATLGISGRLTFLGAVDDSQLVELYAGALAVLYAPYDEDYGYITLEAFLARKPVITADDSGGTLEFVRDRINGLICEPTAEAIGDAVNLLSSDRRLAGEYGGAGFERARAISWDGVIEKLHVPMTKLIRLCCNFRAATSGWTTFGKHRTGSPIMPSDNPFKWRQFEPALILQGVRWYLRYALSYRDLEDMMRERGLCVDHTTIYRWVQRYAPEIDKRCRPFLRRTNDSYRIDETYVRVAGAWT